MTLPATTDVLIVGAGPTGLSLSAQLDRYGVDHILVDRKDGVEDLSKAIVLHARSLEIYDQMGLAQPALHQGRVLHKVEIADDGKVVAAPDFSAFGRNDSAFPFFLILPQSDNERLLLEHLRMRGRDVAWDHAFLGCTQDADGVTARLKGPDGAETEVRARYLVGCDGAGSAVRKALGLRFEGDVDPRRFYVVDAEMTINPPFERGGSDEAALVICIGREKYVMLLPLPGQDQWRLNGNIEVEDKGGEDGQAADIPFELIEQQVRDLVQRDIAIRGVNWVSNYRVHTRHTERFREGRGFVAGDAAHVHTPAGGQGMNTGIQDAYNLAWKLALVLRHEASDQLLDTYEEERLANARRLLSTTDTFFEVLAGDSWAMHLLRKYALPTFMNAMPRVRPIRRHMFHFLSQTGITYRGQRLAPPPHGIRGRVGPGDRLPHLVINGEGVHARLDAPRFHAVVFSNEAVAVAEVDRRFGGLVSVVVLPLDPAVEEVFGIDETFTVVLRPDNHVAAIGRGADLDLIDRYLTAVVRLPVQARRAPISLRFANTTQPPTDTSTR